MTQQSTIKVTYRDIAKMLCKAMPITGEDFGLKVEEYIEAIKRLPKNARVALKSAYIFSAKAPVQEREDLFGVLTLGVLQSQTKDEKLGYAIARCDWLNWWKKWVIRQHYSLDSLLEEVEQETGNPTLHAELIVGAVEYERLIDGKIDAELLWNKLPDNIKPLIEKRLQGQALTHSNGGRGRPRKHDTLGNTERSQLNRWLKSQGNTLLASWIS